jgi:hypothetical protein
MIRLFLFDGRRKKTKISSQVRRRVHAVLLRRASTMDEEITMSKCAKR